MKKRGHAVVVATYSPQDFFRAYVESHEIEYRCFHKSYRFDPTPVWQLFKTITLIKPHVVITFLRTPSIYAEIVKVFKPSLNLIVSERAGVDLNGFSTRDYLASYGHLLATHATTNSIDYRERMIQAVPALSKMSTVIYNCLLYTSPSPRDRG